MDHKQLRAFLTIAETGNMTRASELLNLVQPAVSRQLRMLEEDVGVQLFERERHGMALTDAGKALLGYARRAMLELDRARAELGGTAGEVAGLVTVGLLPSTCDVLAGPLISAVSSRYPNVRMNITVGYTGTLQQWLEKGDIDVAVLYGAERVAHIHATPLLKEPLWLVGPASAKLQKRRPVTLASLAEKTMIMPNGPQGVRNLVDHACAISSITLRSSVETNAMSIQKSLVLGGHGYTILPPISFAAELASGQLTGAPIVGPEISRTLLLALPANRSVSRHVRLVVELMLENVKDAVKSKRWPEAQWIAG